MYSSNFLILQDMLKEFNQECNELQEKIDANLLRIKEIEYFEDSILTEEDADFKVFSPRNVESVHKSELQHVREEKEIYKKENAKLLEEKEKIFNRINQINTIIRDESVQGYASLEIQENERQRIARELHDTSLQNLAHLVHKIELSTMYIDKDPLEAKLELSVVNKNLKSIIEEIRNTIFDLRPMTFDDLGMKAALERLVTKIVDNQNYEMDVVIEDVSCEKNLVLLYIYRTIQECLTNIVKHAQATKIYFHCKVEDNFYHVIIQDNGRGFTQQEVEEKADMHFGLSLIKERIVLVGGRITILSHPDTGTKIEMEVPIK